MTYIRHIYQMLIIMYLYIAYHTSTFGNLFSLSPFVVVVKYSNYVLSFLASSTVTSSSTTANRSIINILTIRPWRYISIIIDLTVIIGIRNAVSKASPHFQNYRYLVVIIILITSNIDSLCSSINLIASFIHDLAVVIILISNIIIFIISSGIFISSIIFHIVRIIVLISSTIKIIVNNIILVSNNINLLLLRIIILVPNVIN
jgi:hypothetical protein